MQMAIHAEKDDARADHLLGWYSRLGSVGRGVFWASFGGFAIDAWDVLLYSFVIPSLSTLWAMTPGKAGVIATTALLTSSLGGWIGGVLSDRIGRVRTLQVTVLWFCLFTGLSGFTNSFQQLLVIRGLQGLGFGAEWAVGAALLGECVRSGDRGRALGFVQSAWAVGWGAAALTYAGIYALLPEHLAWRAVFFTGVLPSVFVFLLRKPLAHVQMPVAHVERRPLLESFTQIFKPGICSRTLFAALLVLGVLGGYYGAMTWLPTYLRVSRGLSVVNTSSFVAVVIVASWFGYATGAYLNDMVGRRASFLIFSLCSGAVVVAYTFLPLSNTAVLIAGFPLGFFASGALSGLGAYLTELFPAHMRGSAMGFTYNGGRAAGALFPALIGYLSSRVTLGHAIGLFCGIAYVLVLVALFFLPEARGIDEMQPGIAPGPLAPASDVVSGRS